MPLPSASPRFLELVPRDFAREHLVIGGVIGGVVGAISGAEVAAVKEPVDGARFALSAPGTTPTLRFYHAPRTDPLILHNLALHLRLAAISSLGDTDHAGTSAIPPATIESEVMDAEVIARLIDDSYTQYELDREARSSAASARTDRDGTVTVSIGTEDAPSDDELDQELRRLASASEQDLLSLGGKGPVIRLVDSVLFEAIGRGASDIHIQPLSDVTLIRYRLDGVLLTARHVPPKLAPALVSRIKIMARMDIAERRAAQDGRATVTIGSRAQGAHGAQRGRAVDLRIATLPSAYGERVVIRLLDTNKGGSLASLDAIGMPGPVVTHYCDRAGRSSGIVLVTGPTGSGKTTTLYATLRWIAARSATGRRVSDVNVMTIEDPIEYDLSSLGDSGDGSGGGTGGGGAAGTGGSGGGGGVGTFGKRGLSTALPISQTQVDPKKGLTFATGLRHILRQDPDVIMVGEIRDEDTARIAIQASLTGHLVFSTLHTADAPGAVTRLIDLKIEPYLVASSLSCVLAQRLVRLVHGGTRPRSPDATDGTAEHGCGGKGCPECLESGFKGRRGIFELLVIESAIRELVANGATATVIRDAGVARGMVRLEQQGLDLVAAGLTTADEVRRVTLGAE